MPRIVVVAGVIATVATSIVMSLLFGDRSSEADQQLMPLRGNGFSVSMPGKAEQSLPTAAGRAPAITYTSGGRDKAYVVTVSDSAFVAALDLAESVEGSARATGGTVRERVVTTYQGFRAIDARISGAGGDKATTFMRIISTRKRRFLLQLVTVGADVKTPPAAYEEFLSSLKIGTPAVKAKASAEPEPIIARKLPTSEPASVEAGLASCRNQAAGQPVSDAVRRMVKTICADRDGEDVEEVSASTLAACIAVAQETGDLERCGFDVVRP